MSGRCWHPFLLGYGSILRLFLPQQSALTFSIFDKKRRATNSTPSLRERMRKRRAAISKSSRLTALTLTALTAGCASVQATPTSSSLCNLPPFPFEQALTSHNDVKAWARVLDNRRKEHCS